MKNLAHGENRLAAWILFGSALLIVILSAFPALFRALFISTMPHGLPAGLRGLYYYASLITIFLVPGTALVLSTFRSKRYSLFELLAAGFAFNVALLILTTSLLKLCGLEIHRSILTSILLYFLLIALIAAIRRRRLPAVYNDFPFSLSFFFAASLAFVILFALLSGYTSLGPDRHWLIERIEKLDFPHHAQPTPKKHGGGIEERGDNFLELKEGAGHIVFSHPGSGEKGITLRYLVSSEVPGDFTIAASGEKKNYAVPQPFNERGKEVCFQNNAVVETYLSLLPGRNIVNLQFRDRNGTPSRCTLLDFTGCDKQAFLEIFGQRYRFVNYVLMYDIMEADDFVSNFKSKVYLYHSPGTPELEGYAVTNPPLSYLFSAFGYILMGEDTAAVNRVAFAVIAAAMFVSVYLMQSGLRRPDRFATASALVGSLSLAVLLTLSVSLHFMTHFMFLCILISWYFLLRKKSFPFIAFSMMACLSAWAGYYFSALGLLCYAIVMRDIRWPLRQLAAITAFAGVFLALLLAAGYCKGMLQPWINIFIWENFRRFGTEHLYQAGSRLNFFTYVIIGTACMPLGLALKRDREVNFFMLFSAFYLATLLIAPSNEWKLHYLSTICFPLMIAGGRSMALAGIKGDRNKGVFALKIVILTGALCGIAYALVLARRIALLA